MVDALQEARRVLKPRGALIDVRSVTIPMALEVLSGSNVIWAKEADSSSTPEDVQVADAAVTHALSNGWFCLEKVLSFDLEIYCHTAEDFRLYAQVHKLPEAGIPYQEMEQRLIEQAKGKMKARLRCRRRWMLSTYRKK